ncbi:nitrile hydratase accessory protein [Aurantimonas marina]|uniref:nitrile hydratase accessory protein n=1 Tax=Aurantimonas marina TaxID=2780508 RepID=UPI0019D1C735|nr:nitrile hydratase accessory protein [Aurantimonas marina]
MANEAPERFAEPWQAELLGLQVALVEAGVFTAAEWAEALGRTLHAPDAAEDGSDYYPRFLGALEGLLAEKALTGTAEVDALTAAWRRAAQATAHGQPIVLANDPQTDGVDK